jgi:hypothetical protein
MSTVYLSSTYEDLKDYRSAVSDAIRSLGHVVIGTEYFGATEGTSLEKSLINVAAADIYVGLFAHRYGYVPESPDNPEGLSITELEYRQAIKNNVPCFIFVLSDDVPRQPKFFDRGDQARKITELRQELLMRPTVGIFSTPDDLAAKVSKALGTITRLESASERFSERSGQQFDVFFSYNIKDQVDVRSLAERLERDGIRVWMDVTVLMAGDDWARETEAAFARARVVCIFVGAAGIGKNQNVEVEKALERKSKSESDFRLIPILLPDVNHELIPLALATYFWVDFAKSVDNPEAYSLLKNTILEGRIHPPEVPPRIQQVIDQPTLEMLPKLLFRLVARLRERPEMLRSLDATAFWDAVRKIQPGASTIEDLRAVNAQLSSEAAPSAIWTAWMKHTKAVELTALLQHPQT